MAAGFPLEDLPVEVLANILNGPSSWAAIELWKTGSRLIRAKLVNGGIQELILKDIHPEVLPVWPRCINEFHLRSLSFQIEAASILPNMLQDHLRSLHSGLKRLVIHAPGVAWAIFAPLATFGLSASLPQPPPAKRPKAGLSGQLGQEEPKYWDLNATHASLEHLEIIDRTFVVGSESMEFSRLPRTLHSLTVLCRRVFLTEDLSELPPDLTSLTLPIGSIGVGALEHILPKSLTHISADSLNHEALLALAKNPEFLPNLERFPDGNSRTFPIYTTLMNSKVTLPYNLYSLDLHGDEEDARIELPRNLRVLSAVRKLLDPKLDCATLKHYLPSTLTELYATGINWKAVTVSVWPRTLTKISVVRDNNFSAERFCLLPRGLKHLNVASDFPMLSANKKSQLADFKASSILALQEEAELWTKWKQSALPRSKKEGDAQFAAMERYIEQAESGALCGLPLSLMTLTLLEIPKKLAKVLLFPPNLQHLGLEECHDALSLFPFWTLLPRSLNSIALGEVDTVPKEPSILSAALPSSSLLFQTHFITKMVIDAYSTSFIETLIPCLPRCLRLFELMANSVQLEANVLQHLPRNLEGLALDSIILKRQPDWALGLPRSLIYFYIDCTELQGSELAQLPPHLETLIAPINAQIEHIVTLPRNLRRLEWIKPLPNAEPTFEGALTHATWKTLSFSYVPFWRAIRLPLDELKAKFPPLIQEEEAPAPRRDKKRVRL